MAFTGVRAEESLARSTYDTVSNGQKHSGQMSCHTILDWTSAELYCYIYARHLHLNEAYKKGKYEGWMFSLPQLNWKARVYKALFI